MAKKKKDYKVGKGKTSEDHQFKPGRSGNPKGRPKGSLNMKTLFSKALSKRVVLRNGKKMTAAQIAIEQLVNKAASGDLGAQKLLFAFKEWLPGAVDAKPSPSQELFPSLTTLEKTFLCFILWKANHPGEFQERQRLAIKSDIAEAAKRGFELPRDYGLYLLSGVVNGDLSSLIFKLLYLQVGDLAKAVEEVKAEVASEAGAAGKLDPWKTK